MKKSNGHNLILVASTLLCAFLLSAPQVHAACTAPIAGDAGEIEYFSADKMFRYCDDTDWIDMEHFFANAVEFELNIDYLDTGSLGADTKKYTASAWIYNDNNSEILYIVNSARVQAFCSGANITFRADNSAGTEIMLVTVDGTTELPKDQWNHLLVSFDMSDTAKAHVVINGVDMPITLTTYTDDLIDFTPGFAVGSRFGLNDYWDGAIAEFWFDRDTYIDLSIAANVEKFIKNGKPVFLGADGSLPTGAQPEVYLTGDTATWHVNKGSVAGFTENGALSDFVDTPSGARATPDACATEGEMFYDSTDEVMQWCNGTEEINMGPNPGTGGTNCTAGTMNYNTATDTLQFCDGTNFIDIGK